ncbi:MAG: type II toxin-antitoxin system PemK/MazF family toxin [Erysipelotrichaceae bacterium]|jgi:hypothetical protein|nr:type II toxin-antitoxin system PemK/MazF family toxin [Erysipelotrichaceae bacterium]
MEGEEVINTYLRSMKEAYQELMPGKVGRCMISEENWIDRGSMANGEEAGIKVKTGDICWMDYGQAYLNEMGYQHFGLIITICMHKALVIPLTSNESAYNRAYDALDNPGGNRCLMRIGLVAGLRKSSTLYLNDMRFVNTARMFEVRAHLEEEDPLFLEVRDRLKEMLIMARAI